MKKLFFLLAFFLSFQSSRASTKDTIPVHSSDMVSLDVIIKSLYDVISGPAGQPRNWDRMRSLFSAEARLIVTGKKPDGMMGRRVMTLEEYIKLSGPVLEKDGFFETEISRKTDQYGAVVHVFSTYESRKTAADPTPFIRGINSIQLWNDGKRWWIINIFWQGESPDNPIPPKYLDKP